MTDEVRSRWEETAREFQAELDLPVGVNWDGLGHLAEADLDLLGDVDGRDVVELGCGGGQCAVALAERGANVVGVDFTGEQLRFARELAAERGVAVAFVQGDVADLPMGPAAAFDVAFNSYVFQWVDDLAAAFTEAYRLLRPDGRFVFAMPHPYYEITDPASHEVAESYFETGRHVVEDQRTDADLVTFRHTVSGVLSDLVDAGFVVERVLEPGTSDPDDYEPGPWGEMVPELMAKVPSTLIVVAEKPA